MYFWKKGSKFAQITTNSSLDHWWLMDFLKGIHQPSLLKYITRSGTAIWLLQNNSTNRVQLSSFSAYVHCLFMHTFIYQLNHLRASRSYKTRSNLTEKRYRQETQEQGTHTGDWGRHDAASPTLRHCARVFQPWDGTNDRRQQLTGSGKINRARAVSEADIKAEEKERQMTSKIKEMKMGLKERRKSTRLVQEEEEEDAEKGKSGDGRIGVKQKAWSGA